MYKLEIKVICSFLVALLIMANNPIPEPLGRIAHVLLVIGGLNWGLVGLLDTNLVSIIADATVGAVGTLVYALVGLSAIISVLDVAMSSK
jgi:uncharacterized membrane protein YuzA (DUF378 family)|tara:strand:- start:327 stop:596 length:270 start_codon:yes stop_codon:yes gene_type:complete